MDFSYQTVAYSTKTFWSFYASPLETTVKLFDNKITDVFAIYFVFFSFIQEGFYYSLKKLSCRYCLGHKSKRIIRTKAGLSISSLF